MVVVMILNASTDVMSYGLKNIQERVDEMAGAVQFPTGSKGTSIDVRVLRRRQCRIR